MDTQSPGPVSPTFSLNETDREIFERIIAPAKPIEKYGLTVNEGYRFFNFGETGAGKTCLQRGVLYYTLMKRYAECAFIHDTKGIFPEYPRSLQIESVAQFKQRGFQPGDIPVVSFRGNPRRDVSVTAEEVAFYSKQLGQKGKTLANGQWAPFSHVCVIEEIAALATRGRKHMASDSALWMLEQGRKVGVSLIGTTQSPRKVPLDILGQASSFGFFRLTGADANYLGDRIELDENLVRVLRGPNGEGLPNHQFCLYVKGEPWDGRIYTLDKRTVTMFE